MSFGAEPGGREHAEQRFRELNGDVYRASFGAQFFSGLVSPFTAFIGNLSYVAVAVVGGIQVATGQVTLGNIQAFIQYVRQFNQPLTQIAGMYNTLLQSDDPALVIECLNGYRLKEKLPANLMAYTVPLGVPEIIKEGTDITMVSYGSTLRIVSEAADALEKTGISCEVVDVQTLLPFDINHSIAE